MSNQLAITPLNEKCFLNLTASINSIECGVVVGAESSGKNQTIHLLAKVV